MKQRFIALVDADNFFASCEQLFNPSLKGKAVCVLGNNDGCVIARSKEAKQLGIKMGMPYFMAKHDFPSAIYLSSNFTLYHDISNRIRDIFRRYSEIIDIYSIDEAFFDVTGLDKVFGMSYLNLAEKIRTEIYNEVGISVSVGISNSKTLAKLAVHKAKQNSGTYIITKDRIKEELQRFPIEEIWGIGRSTSAFFRSIGVFFADAILDLPESILRKNLGIKGLEIKQELSGENFIGIQKETIKAKSVQRTCAFEKFTSDKMYIKEYLFKHLHNACKYIRAENLQAKSIGVFLRTKGFQVYYKTIQCEQPSNSEIYLIKYVNKLFDQIFDDNIIYRSSGIFLNELFERGAQQMTFLNKISDNIKKEKVSRIWDKLESKYGKGAIGLGILPQRQTDETKYVN